MAQSTFCTHAVRRAGSAQNQRGGVAAAWCSDESAACADHTQVRDSDLAKFWAASNAPWQPASRAICCSVRKSYCLASAGQAAESLLAQMLPRCAPADSRPRHCAQERLALADANRRSQLAERRTKAVAFSAKTQEAAARLQARSAALAERLRTSLADAQARAFPGASPAGQRGSQPLQLPGSRRGAVRMRLQAGAATALAGERRLDVMHQHWSAACLLCSRKRLAEAGEQSGRVCGRRRAGRARRRSARPGWRARRARSAPRARARRRRPARTRPRSRSARTRAWARRGPAPARSPPVGAPAPPRL